MSELNEKARADVEEAAARAGLTTRKDDLVRLGVFTLGAWLAYRIVRKLRRRDDETDTEVAV